MMFLPTDPAVVNVLALRRYAEVVNEMFRRFAVQMKPVIAAFTEVARRLDAAIGPDWRLADRARATEVGWTGPTLTPRQLAHWHRTAGRR